MRKPNRRQMTVCYMILSSLGIIGASCDPVLDKPWHENAFFYRHNQQLMQNLVRPDFKKPAAEMDGAVCKGLEWEIAQEQERVSCLERLKLCEKKTSNDL